MLYALPWRTLLVGCGDMGMLYDSPQLDERCWPQSHALAIARHPGFALVGLVEADPGRRAEAQRRFPACAVFTEWESALDEVPLDVAVIATPPDQRLAMVEAALAAGAKHVFCEKPLAISAVEARRIADACRDANAGLTVNYSRRWSRSIATARERVVSGALGSLQLITGYYRGALSNNGTHLLDLALWFAGALDLEQSLASGHPQSPHLILRSANGSQVRLHALPESGLDLFELDLVCLGGRVRLAGGGYDVSVWVGDVAERGTSRYILPGAADNLPSDGAEVLWRAYVDLKDAVNSDWEETAALRDALRVSVLIEEALADDKDF